MLRHLSIRHFVIVEQMDLEFESGFTVLTGETGAGKSILIDALSLVLGKRADALVVSPGAERAEVSAEFDISTLGAFRGWLADNDLSGDADSCVMRRVVDVSGRSRNLINGHSTTLTQMREAGEFLVDIHGQHSHQSLLRSQVQREILDAYAAATATATVVAAAYRDWLSLRKQRQHLEKNAQALAAEREQLQWKVKELEALNLAADEWQTLNSKHTRAAHSASLLEAAQTALHVLSEGENASLAHINALHARFERLVEYDQSLKDIAQLLGSAHAELQECIYSLQRYQQRFDFEPNELRSLEQRIEAIHSMARKCRVTPKQLPGLLLELRAQLLALGSDESNAQLQQQEEVAGQKYQSLAEKLSQIRKKTAKRLSSEITSAMQTLAMAGGRFEVGLVALQEGTAHGLEQVEYFVSAHSSIPPRPLEKVASGGELSRISLAIQAVTSRQTSVPTLIFDEVDAGIGGKVAEIVGKMLKKLGKEHQVTCITHLPQVAASGDRQWQVSKSSRNGKLVSKVTVLDKQQRVEEIARMLGGAQITETTRDHAKEMLWN